MNFFRKRSTPVENLTLIAIVAGIDGLFSLFSALLPLGALFLMFAIPLLSALVAIFCKKGYYPIYIFVAAGVSLAVSAWEITNTIFYLIPSLFTGGLYGILIDRKVPSSINIFVTSLLQFLLFIASLFLIKAIYGVDMEVVLLTFANKGESPSAPIVFPLFGYAYALAQVTLAHLFAIISLTHLGIEIPEEKKNIPMYPLFGFFFIAVALGFSFLSPTVGYVFLGFGIYWSIFAFSRLFDGVSIVSWIVFGICAFIALILFAALYRKMPEYCGLLLIGLGFLAADISSFLHCLLLRKKRSDPTMK